MNSLLDTFLAPDPSLKICGVTNAMDADRLADLGVPALGVNFWEHSKRFCPVLSARDFLPGLKDRILRVGVFVNADPGLPRQLLAEDLIDLVQLHGDEDLAYCQALAEEGLPFIVAAGVDEHTNFGALLKIPACGLLLDAPAPGVYGGTGRTIDWTSVAQFIDRCSPPPIILAGGITPENAAQALAATRAAALDVASGAESSPGQKDFAKVKALLAAVRSAHS